MPTMAQARVKRHWLFEFQLRKVEFVFFTSQQPLRVVACYEGSGPKVYALDIIIQLQKVEFLFLLHGRKERTCLM